MRAAAGLGVGVVDVVVAAGVEGAEIDGAMLRTYSVAARSTIMTIPKRLLQKSFEPMMYVVGQVCLVTGMVSLGQTPCQAQRAVLICHKGRVLHGHYLVRAILFQAKG